MKRKIYFSIVLLAALSCSRETLIDDSAIQVPEGERLSFAADLGSMVKSHFAEDGTTLEWDTDDRVYVTSAYSEDGSGTPLAGADKWGSALTEVMPVVIDSQDPTKATFLSGKARSAWVNAGDGKYSFYAVYPASAANMETSPVIEDDVLWAPVRVPYSQDGKHFGKYQICADFTGTSYGKDAILDNTTRIQFNDFQPKTALLNFNATSAAGDIPIKEIEIFASWVDYGTHSSYPQITGDAFISEAGVIRPGSGGSTLTVRLDTPITIGETAGERILAAILPTESDAVVLDFTCYDAEHNPRLTGKITSPDGFLGGKKYTFTVAMTEAETSVFAVDCVRNFPPEGGTYTGRVVSFTYIEGVKTAVDWDLAAFEDANCTVPVDDISAFENWAHFTSAFTPSDTEVGVTTFEYAVNANTNVELISRPDDVTAEIRAALRGATYRGDKANNSPWNLAASDGSLTPSKFNSANCYIINQPGYYLLPCVAGNGIKGGNPNTTAYQPLSTYEDDRDPLFVDYLGAQIVDPRIGHTSAGSGTPYAAYLLWEDADGLISTSADFAPVFSSDLPDATKGYLETIRPYALPVIYDSATGMWGIVFEVEPGNIDQGNAVIAVVDEQARIMWSWHIWATDYNPYQSVIPVRSYWSNGDYGYMKRNLGWVSVGKSNEIKYRDNTMYVKVWQVRTNPETGLKEAIPESEGGRSIIVPLIQEGTHLFDADIQYGYGPYYQAGRKDPLTPGKRGSDGYMQDVQTYGAVKTLTGLDFVSECRAATLADGIQYPYTYFHQYVSGSYSNGSGWFTDNISDTKGFLWNNTEIPELLGGGMISKVITRKDPTVKTVYDPNPAGFTMPPMDAGGTFFAFFTGGKYENYLVEMGGEDGAALREKYVSLLVSASEYGCLYYASLADKERDAAGSGPVNMGFLPQVGRRYNQLGGHFQTSAFVDVENSGSTTSYINEMANTPNCGGYYSNFVMAGFAPVMLCAYPYMYYGFLTVSSSALPVRSVVEE